MEWLDNWENEYKSGKIHKNEFLTESTSNGLRVTVKSTLDLCSYLITQHNFKYLLSGKINQDKLEVILHYNS